MASAVVMILILSVLFSNPESYLDVGSLRMLPAGRTALQTIKRFVLVHHELRMVKAAGLAQVLRWKGSLESCAEDLKECAVNTVISQGNGFVFCAVEISAPCDDKAKISSHAQV